MKNSISFIVALSVLGLTLNAHSQIQLSGYFIARDECPAYQSFRRQTNPGDVTTRADHAYDLLAKNKAPASHYLIKMDAEPDRRWVPTSCGEHVIPVDVATPVPEPVAPATTENPRYILAVSWQPGFCEGHSSKPECTSQTADRFDASHFTLHGLWPQPRDNIYCYVTPEEVAKDKNTQWPDLQELALDEETREELDETMPGTQSFLHRHEWTKHGSCYNGKSSDKYFQDSLKLMRELNSADSTVRKLFADNIGQQITSTQIRDAFDDSFGDGASDKIKITCKRDGGRRLIIEITIGLQGELDEISMSDALFAAPNANDIGCTEGVVDAVGFQ